MFVTAVDPSFFALAVVAGAVGSLDDASGAIRALMMTVVAFAVEGLGPARLVQEREHEQNGGGAQEEGGGGLGEHDAVKDVHLI